MPRMATQEEFEDYKDNPLCPYCYAEDVVEDGTTTEGAVTKKFMYCTKCELRWTEIWENGEMTGIYLDDAD